MTKNLLSLCDANPEPYGYRSIELCVRRKESLFLVFIMGTLNLPPYIYSHSVGSGFH